MPVKKSQPRKKQSHAKKPARKNPVKKISRISGSEKKRTILRTSKKPSERKTKTIQRNKATTKRGVLESPRQVKKRENESRRLRKNASERARYALRTKKGKVSADTKYWLTRKSSKKSLRAKYTTKSIRTPRTTDSFQIRKKVKAVKEQSIDSAMIEVGKGMSSYLKLKDVSKKHGKDTYIKIMIRDSQGNTRWVSSKRDEFLDKSDVTDRLEALKLAIKGYGSDFSIIGYEAEETIDDEYDEIEEYQDDDEHA